MQWHPDDFKMAISLTTGCHDAYLLSWHLEPEAGVLLLVEDRLEGTMSPRGKEGDSEVVGKGEEGQVGGMRVG